MNKLNGRAKTLSLLAFSSALLANGATPVFHHPFDTATDASGKLVGTLSGDASLKKYGSESVVCTGENGYFDFGASLGDIIKGLTGDYSLAVNLYIPTSTALGRNGNFIFTFANGSDNGYVFFGANESRYSVTETSWTGEQTVSAKTAFPRGEWVNVVIVNNNNKVTIYFNGEQKGQGDISLQLSKLGNTPLNRLGYSPYNGDVLLKNAEYADFKIYNTALSASEIAELANDASLSTLNEPLYTNIVEEVARNLSFDFSAVRANLNLPKSFSNGVVGEWKSSDTSIIDSDGTVHRPGIGSKDAELELTLTLSKNGVTRELKYPAKVMALLSDEASIAFDLDNIVLPGMTQRLRSDLRLPATTAEGTYLVWESHEPDYISHQGRLHKMPGVGEEAHEVKLTVTGYRGELSATREFSVKVAPREDYVAYLFTYFPSNSNEHLYYAVSTNGFSYTPLNGGQRILDSADISRKGGIRDPHILRGEDGKTFYMVATDMKCSEGWDSNRGMVLLKSTDLVNWTHSTIHFPDRFPEWKNVTRVWAPEVIWDPEYVNTDGSKGRYMVYYSLLTNDGKCPYDKIYYTYVNDDFTDFITEPEFFFDRGSATIDGDIVYDELTGLYHLVYKNEGSGGICQVTASRLTPEPGQKPGSQWQNPSAGLQQTNVAVEGAGMFRLIDTDTWVLMYDCYNDGYYQFCTSDDLENFVLRTQTATSGAFTPRHGTVIPITQAEYDRLLEAFPISGTARKITGARNRNVRENNFKATSTSVYIPVVYGTDLHNFDPMLTSTPGSKVSPEGPQDFTKGAVTYTVKRGDQTNEYSVTAAVEVNPILPGFHADPEIVFSHKTGRFYIYSTTDGVPGWGGHTFWAYSSPDLVNWTKENIILDLATDDVTWATGNAWAPCIEEKIVDGDYKYYFYFSGHNPDLNYKTLGCAVADSPTGPFRDLGYPMVSTNITGGQLIDSDVFTDPVSGNTYFYWGNGNLVASKLEDDMTTYTDAKVITPSGGSLSDYAFREGVYVFYRNGIYYFLWSVDDTGAKNYHVAYGTSDSPMGPIKVASQPIVLIQSASNSIYGTGHNSVIQIPGKDEWYIVYHRINKSFVSNGPGYHREVCIDKLEFNEDGTIKRVTPTHEGIAPVSMGSYMTPLIQGVETIGSDATAFEIVKTLYYNLDGVNLGSTVPSEPGLYIKAEIMANGKVNTSKFIR